MRKLFCIVAMMMAMVFLSSCDDNEPNERRAGIIAEDFVKDEVLSPNDLDYDVVGVDETDYQTYHVVANIKTLNGLGMKVPRKVSIRLVYLGDGDWEDKTNWSCVSVKFLNESTGEMQ